MPAELDRRVLMQLISDTLEETAFVFTEPADEPPPPFEGEPIRAEIPVSGSARGRLALTTCLEQGRLLAANFLGVDPDDPEAMGKEGDAVGELLNILGGVLLGTLYPARTQPQMGTPSISSPAPTDASATAPGLFSLISEEGCRIDVLVELE